MKGENVKAYLKSDIHRKSLQNKRISFSCISIVANQCTYP